MTFEELLATAESFDSPPDDAHQPVDGIVTVCMEDVRVAPVQWAWEDRIPLGLLSLLARDPGLGKSTLTVQLAAQWSRGEADGDLQGTPTSVLLASAEDSAETTLKPRLIEAGADMSRIHIVQMRKEGVLGGITLPDDVAALEAKMTELDARVFIIDPLFAHLSDRVNSFKDQDLRRALAPLSLLAERLDAAVVAVLHLNKDEQKDVLGRISGSKATVAAARSVLLAAPDPHDPDGATKLLGHIKCNVGPLAVTLGYHIEERHLSIEGQEITTSALVWEGELPEVKARDLLARTEQVDRNKREEAKDWLRELLKQGPKPTEEIYLEGKKLTFSESTLNRAKHDLGIKAQKHTFSGKGAWSWQLPPEEYHDEAEEPHSSTADTLRQFSGEKPFNDGDFYEERHQEDIDTLRSKDSVPYPAGAVIRFNMGLGREETDTIAEQTEWAQFPGQVCYRINGGRIIPHSRVISLEE